MERLLKKYAIAASAVILTIMLVLGISIMMRGTDPAVQAFEQGDKYFTVGGNSPYCVGGDSGAIMVADPLPYDGNRQVVVCAIDSTGFLPADVLQVLTKSDVSPYTTTTEAFHAGTSTYVHLSDASIGNGGVSYFVVDDGAGTAGWFESRGKISTDIVQVLSNANSWTISNTNAPSCGVQAMAGVTFPSGSRVYPMRLTASYTIGAAGIQRDNNPGLVTATKGSPVLVLVDYSGSSAGTSRFFVTGEYK